MSSILFILQRRLGIVNSLPRCLVCIENDVGIDAIKNGKLCDARAHGKNGMLGLLCLGKKRDIRCRHKRRGAMVGNTNSCGSADLAQAHCLHNILGCSRVRNANGNASALEMRRNDRLQVVITARLRRKSESQKLVSRILRDRRT